MLSSSISHPELIKFHYFADATEREVKGGSKDRVTLGDSSNILLVHCNGSSSSQVVPQDIPNSTSVVYDYSYPMKE
jgi:hypothetical protein